MAQSFYFYDLETSSASPKTGRIMQFAGQRTTMDLEPIGEPDNLLVKLAPDILPDPYAVLVHGITPQQTLMDGISEAELTDHFETVAAQPGTVFVGFNNIRFDDEFIRSLMYRDLRDPFAWHWQEGRSRWDLLDPLRMMRALRPEGLEWPFASDGSPTVRLEFMSKVNGIDHTNAHDALADIQALIAITKRFKTVQPKLFDYLLNIRDKKRVQELVTSGSAFVYTSGKYPSEFQKTTVVQAVVADKDRAGAYVVFDLRHDPLELTKYSPAELAKKWRSYKPDDRLPLKTLMSNRCPAVAPLAVLDEESMKRIQIDMTAVKKHASVLKQHPGIIELIEKALQLVQQEQHSLIPKEVDVDADMLNFWSDDQKRALNGLRKLAPEKMLAAAEREGSKIAEMTFRYVARNFEKKLTAEQRERWEEYRKTALLSGGQKSALAVYYQHAQEVMKRPELSKQDQYLLTELQLYVESILPELD